jgi:hypothetical protein
LVTHNYGHLRDLCRDLTDAGLGGGVLFYLPGYNARYDAGYPLYSPSDELGGSEGFAEMVSAVHQAGHWVMPHVNIRGCDPYRPYFEEVQDLAVPYDPEEARKEDGRLESVMTTGRLGSQTFLRITRAHPPVNTLGAVPLGTP